MDQRDARLVGQPAERVRRLELVLVGGDREVIARRDHRCASRGQILATLAPAPRDPPASGLQGMTPIPNSRQVGSTSASMPRARIEYGGCSQTKRWCPRSRATHCALTICAAGYVEEPM